MYGSAGAGIAARDAALHRIDVVEGTLAKQVEAQSRHDGTIDRGVQ